MMKHLFFVLLMGCSVMMATAQELRVGEQRSDRDFARGADVSWCSEMEADGRKFYNTDGAEREMMALMKEIGMTAIRLRVWVNPQKYGYGSWSDKADVVAKAKRAHAQGLDLMIDFQYSDTFADPETQIIPLDWQECSEEELKTAMVEHTEDVLQALKDEGIEPKWVQVGNETNSGMMHPTAKVEWDKSGTARFKNYVNFSNAGYDAVKKVFPNAYVIVHLGGADKPRWFFPDFKAAGGKFDMIGMSHYPTEAEWNSTASDANFSNINAAQWVEDAGKQFGVPVMICETGFDVSKPALASQVLRDLFTRLKDLPQCAGIFYWEPEVDGKWKPDYYDHVKWTDSAGNTHTGWGPYGMGAFTTSGKPTVALDAFSGKTSEETGTFPSELKVFDKSGTPLVTILQTSEGVYSGLLNVTEGWQNFFVVDEGNNIWYGSDPADKTVLSAADDHWNLWIDSGKTGVYDIVVNLNTMTWTHAFNQAATTGITSLDATNKESGNWYDLQGRLLRTPVSGLYLLRKKDGSVKKIYHVQ